MEVQKMHKSLTFMFCYLVIPKLSPFFLLFQDPSLKNLSLISHVISSSVANITVNNLKTNVTVTLQNVKPIQV